MTSSGHAVTGSSFQKSKLLRNWGDSSSSRPTKQEYENPTGDETIRDV